MVPVGLRLTESFIIISLRVIVYTGAYQALAMPNKTPWFISRQTSMMESSSKSNEKPLSHTVLCDPIAPSRNPFVNHALRP